jgi:hypothetical protein
MSVPKLTVLFGVVLFTLSVSVKAQDSTKLDRLISLPDKVFSFIDKKTKITEEKLERQTSHYINSLQKQESKLKQKLWKKDSILAKQLFPSDLHVKYEQIKTPAAVNKNNVYSGHLDSISTAINFLQTKSLPINAGQFRTIISHQADLQFQLNVSDQLQKFLKQRQTLLKEQFQKLGLVKELNKYRQQLYYYQDQVREYKEAFEDPEKLEKKLMQLLMHVPEFKQFFANNSVLSSLFALPGPTGNSTVSLQGLQTRAMMNQNIADRFGTAASVTQVLQQNLQAAQGQMNELKNKISQFNSGSYGNSENIDLPQGFKPNSEKTKSFLKRLEIGTNIQSQKARMQFPVTSDLGLSLGYKFNDKSVIGIGASGKIGWGTGWNNIQLSYQGLALRSYVDCQLKGNIYITGGYEMNYRSLIHSIQQLQNYSVWQYSGLIGLSKKYHVNKKVNGEMKMLWDFMSHEQMPRTQPILFRIGYSLK